MGIIGYILLRKWRGTSGARRAKLLADYLCWFCAACIISALSSAKRAPTRSECFMNFSVQLITHVSSFEDKVLLVKSLQQDVKQRSTILE